MPVNAGYEYFAAEKKYLAAHTTEEKIACLEEMIKAAPKHKSSENFVANLKQRLNKMIEKKDKAKKMGKSSKKGIRKEGFQVVIVGYTNTGKSSLLAALTNATPKIYSYPFTTKEAEVGTMQFEGIKVQIVDMPAIDDGAFDIGLAHTADAILMVIDSFDQYSKIQEILKNARGKHIVAYNKSDIKSENEIRKIEETIKSKKIPGILISANTLQNIVELKRKIISLMDVVRVYTKEPGKAPSHIPVVVNIGSTVKDIAECIANGFSKKIVETRISGPSSKFANQKVGLSHIVKDKDIVEFHTR